MSFPQPPPLSGTFPVAIPHRRDHLAIVGASAVCFVISCAMPALLFQSSSGPDQPWFGGMIFILGWMGALVGQFAWFANLLLLGSWISLGFRWRFGSVVFPLVALLIAAQTFTLFGESIPADEGGTNKLVLLHLMPGFYFWIASIVISAAGGILSRNRKPA